MTEDSGHASRSDETFRVAFVAEGTGRVAEALGERITRLTREGFEVDVLARPTGGTDELERRGATVIPTPWRFGANPVRLATGFIITQSRFLEAPPTLVHGFGVPMAWVAAIAGERVPAPAIFSSVDDHRWEPSDLGGGDVGLRAYAPGVMRAVEEVAADFAGGVVAEGREWMYRQIASRSDAYLVSSRRDAATLRSRDIVESPKMQRMEPGVGIEVTHFDPEDDTLPTRDEARQRLGCPGQWRKVVAYRGDGRATRGTTDLLEVITRTARRRPDVGWLIQLEAPARGRIVRRLESLEEAGSVRLVGAGGDGGPGADPAVTLRAADLVIEPSLEPEVSLRAMEGSAMRRAVVGYDTSAQRAVVLDGQTGRLVPTRSVDRLAESVLELLDDPSRLEDLGIRAGARAHEHFDRVNIDQRVLEKYDTVLSEALSR